MGELRYQYLESPTYVSTYVGAPIKEYEAAAKTAHDNYDLAVQRDSLLKTKMAEINVDPKARPLIDAEVTKYEADMKKYFDEGNLQDANTTISNGATKFATNPKILAAVNEKKVIDATGAQLNAKFNSGKINAFKYDISMKKLRDDYQPAQTDQFGYIKPYVPEPVPDDNEYDKIFNGLLNQWEADGKIKTKNIYDSQGKLMQRQIVQYVGVDKGQLQEAMRARLKQQDVQPDLDWTVKNRGINKDKLIEEIITPYVEKGAFNKDAGGHVVNNPEWDKNAAEDLERLKQKGDLDKINAAKTEPETHSYDLDVNLANTGDLTDAQKNVLNTADDSATSFQKVFEEKLDAVKDAKPNTPEAAKAAREYKLASLDWRNALAITISALPPALQEQFKGKLAVPDASGIEDWTSKSNPNSINVGLGALGAPSTGVSVPFGKKYNTETYLDNVKAALGENGFKIFNETFNQKLRDAYTPKPTVGVKLFNEGQYKGQYDNVKQILSDEASVGMIGTDEPTGGKTTAYKAAAGQEIEPMGVGVNPYTGLVNSQYKVIKKGRKASEDAPITYNYSYKNHKKGDVRIHNYEDKENRLLKFIGLEPKMMQDALKTQALAKAFKQDKTIQLNGTTPAKTKVIVNYGQVGTNRFVYQIYSADGSTILSQGVADSPLDAVKESDVQIDNLKQ